MTPEQCEKLHPGMLGKNEEETFVNCKAELGKKLFEKCEGTKVDNPGTLLWCRIRGERTCCFRNS